MGYLGKLNDQNSDEGGYLYENFIK